MNLDDVTACLSETLLALSIVQIAVWVLHSLFTGTSFMMAPIDVTINWLWWKAIPTLTLWYMFPFLAVLMRWRTHESEAPGPIFDWVFPWYMDNVFGPGLRSDLAHRIKQCPLHIGLGKTEEFDDLPHPFHGHMCITTKCMSWKWTQSKKSMIWKFPFVARRGVCNHPMVRKGP